MDDSCCERLATLFTVKLICWPFQSFRFRGARNDFSLRRPGGFLQIRTSTGLERDIDHVCRKITTLSNSSSSTGDPVVPQRKFRRAVSCRALAHKLVKYQWTHASKVHQPHYGMKLKQRVIEKLFYHSSIFGTST